ncbi:MAG: glycoside hydrolase family 65 protein [Acidimicrobiales bacterium]
MIEVVLWDCGHPAPGTGSAAELPLAALDRLSALGVDVVLVASPDDAAEIAALEQRGGPGRTFLWSGQPPQVIELGSAPWPAQVMDASPEEWARRHLVGMGGPDAVLTATDRAQLDDLAAPTVFPAMADDRAWTLEVASFDPGREGDVEAWLTVGNGRTGTRGSLEEASAESAGGVLVAGVFGRIPGDQDGPELAPGPIWTHLEPRVDGEAVELQSGETTEHRRVLDLRQATLFREWRQRLTTGQEWSFRSARFASLADRQVLAMQAEARVGQGPGVISTAATAPAGWRAGTTASISLVGEVPVPAAGGVVGSVEVTDLGDQTVLSLHASGGASTSFAIADERSDSGDGESHSGVERFVAVERAGGPDAHQAVTTALSRARSAGVVGLHAHHRRAWRDRWRHADVSVKGDSDTQEALRFALYHLISAADPESDAASVGARAMTGPGYRGHVFWDTEVFVLPFFIWTHPPTARALLAYRYRALPQARAKAARFGYQGALYPWEAADTGEEVTPAFIDLPDGTTLSILTGKQEHHISADVAWATWQYWQATGDDEFLVTMGAELLVETARFWASRTRRDDDGRHHIDEVIGPDEYHEGVDDNAYTNVLARWALRTAAEVCALVPTIDAGAWAALIGRLDLRPAEIEQWEAVAAGLADGFDPDSRLYEQFAGFFSLENIRAVDLAPRPFTGEMIVGVDRLRHTQVVKQADVVMLAHMLPESVPADVASANYDYYEPRTCHGSSLSPAIHAAVAARLGALDQAMTYFRAAASLDLRDQMGNAAKGVHIATMGGLWQAAVFGFGGVQPGRDGVRIDPHLPPTWEKLAFPLHWRGTLIDVEVTAATLRLHLDGPATVAVGNEALSELRQGSFVAHRHGDAWSAVDQGSER